VTRRRRGFPRPRAVRGLGVRFRRRLPLLKGLGALFCLGVTAQAPGGHADDSPLFARSAARGDCCSPEARLSQQFRVHFEGFQGLTARFPSRCNCISGPSWRTKPSTRAARTPSTTPYGVVPLPRFAWEDRRPLLPHGAQRNGGGGPREAWWRAQPPHGIVGSLAGRPGEKQ
jgi:hypothetical protein